MHWVVLVYTSWWIESATIFTLFTYKMTGLTTQGIDMEIGSCSEAQGMVIPFPHK